MKNHPRLIVFTFALGMLLMGCGSPPPLGSGVETGNESGTKSVTTKQGVESDREYKDAVLSSQSLALKVPNPQRQTSSSRTAYYYQITYNVSTSINRGITHHLNLLEDISAYPPTSRFKNKRVWGPWTPALSPASYIFVVEKTAPGRYKYALQGKHKGAADITFRSIFSGVIQRGLLPQRGAGTFVIDFEKARQLDPVTKSRGVAHVTYDNRNGAVNINLHMKGLLDSKGNLSEAQYQYQLAQNGDGSFKYAYLDDMVPSKSSIRVQETALIHSRWLQGGSGRANAVVSGGDLGATKLQFSECWDTLFRRTFYIDNKNMYPTEGNATSCVF